MTMTPPEELVRKLNTYGEYFGFATLGTAVVVVGPGAPFTVEATWYSPIDLESALNAGALKKRQLSGSFELEIYVIN